MEQLIHDVKKVMDQYGKVVDIRNVNDRPKHINKFIITMSNSRQFFFRIEQKQDNSSMCFAIEEWIYVHGAPIHKPIALGSFGSGFYRLYEWVEGRKIGDSYLNTLTKESLYAIGYEVGKTLKAIHNTPPPRFSNKKRITHIFYVFIDLPFVRKLRELRHIKKFAKDYKKYEVEYGEIKGYKKILSYLVKNPGSLCVSATNLVVVHGDYSRSNLILTVNGGIVAVDVTPPTRYLGLGDYETELVYGMRWFYSFPCVINGIVHGYFMREPTVNEWKRIKAVSLFAICSVINNPTLQKHYDEILCAYKALDLLVPEWYSSFTK